MICHVITDTLLCRSKYTHVHLYIHAYIINMVQTRRISPEESLWATELLDWAKAVLRYWNECKINKNTSMFWVKRFKRVKRVKRVNVFSWKSKIWWSFVKILKLCHFLVFQENKPFIIQQRLENFDNSDFFHFF